MSAVSASVKCFYILVLFDILWWLVAIFFYVIFQCSVSIISYIVSRIVVALPWSLRRFVEPILRIRKWSLALAQRVVESVSFVSVLIVLNVSAVLLIGLPLLLVSVLCD